MAAKVGVTRVEKETGKYSKHIWQGLERILAKDWNIKRPTWHGGDILGNECQNFFMPGLGLFLNKERHSCWNI
jgi:hypothetical protein